MHKKIIFLFVVIAVVFSFASFSDSNEIAIYINEDKVDFYDTLPFIDENDRTIVPVRFISESFDAYVKWYSETREVKIIKDDKTIILKIDSNVAKINGESIEMDTKALIVNNRTVVPLRFVSEAFQFEINYKYDYDIRDDNEKKHIIDIYNVELLLYNELKKVNDEEIDITKYNLTIKDMDNLNEEMIDLFPDLFFSDRFVYTYSENEVMSIKYLFDQNIGVLKEEYDNLVNESNEIIEEIIKDNMSDYEKEIAIHDYLVEHVEYDINNEYSTKAHTAYGAIVNNIAVCDGYAEAFDYLLKKVGIKSKLIFGKTENISHAWNLVEIEDELYFVDVTSDDPINNEENIMSYNYFNVPYVLIMNSHEVFEDYSYVNHISENYFYKNDLLFGDEVIAIEYINNKLIEDQGNTRLYFMLDSEISNYNIDIENIINNYIDKNRSIFTGSYSYIKSYKDDDLIFDISIDVERK